MFQGRHVIDMLKIWNWITKIRISYYSETNILKKVPILLRNQRKIDLTWLKNIEVGLQSSGIGFTGVMSLNLDFVLVTVDAGLFDKNTQSSRMLSFLLLWEMSDMESLEILQPLEFLYLVSYFFYSLNYSIHSRILVSCTNLYKSLVGWSK